MKANQRRTKNSEPKSLETMPGPQRILTGISGLDDILNGGLPQGHLYLVEGDPGTGKTTLALQFLLAGVKQGEKVIYVTLSESRRELEQVISSHGWSSESLQIYEMAPLEDDLGPEAQYTVFHPSEVELADTMTAILEQVDAIQPRRIVFDSLSELRMMARDPLRYRRQILSLKRHFAGRNCTVLLLDDRTAEGSHDLQLQSIAHGVVMMQSLERDFGIKRRRLEVRKLRGSPFREGFHDYTIETGGLSIFPRLIAAEHKPGFTRKPVLSGIPALDSLFGGGIDTGTSTLFIGPAGCGKSTLALRYAISSAQRGEKAVIFTFDEALATLLERAKGLGMELSPFLADGSIEIQQIDPAELAPGSFVSRVRSLVDEQGLRVVVLDSLNGFLNAMPHEQFLIPANARAALLPRSAGSGDHSHLGTTRLHRKHAVARRRQLPGRQRPALPLFRICGRNSPGAFRHQEAKRSARASYPGSGLREGRNYRWRAFARLQGGAYRNSQPCWKGIQHGGLRCFLKLRLPRTIAALSSWRPRGKTDA